MASTSPNKLLIIACGALAKELMWLHKHNAWEHVDITCLDAALHNDPAQIPPKVEALIATHYRDYARIYVAYADCGTGGALDAVLARWQVQRLPGAHCYSVFAGESVFTAWAEAEPGTFYLTDFLARHFKRLVIEGLKLEEHPELKPIVFGNYRRVLYLSQAPTLALEAAAQTAAQWLQLPLHVEHTGLSSLNTLVQAQVITMQTVEHKSLER